MANVYNFFKFLKDKANRDLPFQVKLVIAPESITKKDLRVKKNLDITDPQIKKLPDNLTVIGFLRIESDTIESLPENLTVTESLIIVNTPITRLPSTLNVHNNIVIEGGILQTLPDNLKTNGSLLLKNVPLKQLPDNLEVNGSLGIDECPVEDIPKGLKIRGSVFGIRNTPLAQKYTKDEIMKMIIDRGGSYSGKIYNHIAKDKK
jgi:hypothetical protein